MSDFDSFAKRFDDLVSSYEQPVEERGLAGDVGSAAMRGIGGALSQIGGGLQASEYSETNQSPVSRFGQWVERKGGDIIRKYRPDSGDGDSWLKKQVLSGVESVPGSLTPWVVGALGSAVAGPEVGIPLGIATLGEQFGGGTWKQRMDQLTVHAPDMPYSQKNELSWMDAGIETGGELASDLIASYTGGLLGQGAKGLEGGIKSLLRSSPKELLTRVAGGYAAEEGTEAGQAYYQSMIDQFAGTGEALTFTESIKQTAIPTGIVFLAIGGGAGGINAYHKKQIINALTNEKAKDTDRIGAYQFVADRIKDPELKDAWAEYAGRKIVNGQPIDLNFTGKSDPTEVTDNLKTTAEKLRTETDENGFQTVDQVIKADELDNVADTIQATHEPYTMPDIEDDTQYRRPESKGPVFDLATPQLQSDIIGSMVGAQHQEDIKAQRRRPKSLPVGQGFEMVSPEESQANIYDQYRPELPEVNVEQAQEAQQTGLEETPQEKSSQEGAKVNADQTRTDVGEPGQENMAGQVAISETNIPTRSPDNKVEANPRGRVENIKGLDLRYDGKQEGFGPVPASHQITILSGQAEGTTISVPDLNESTIREEVKKKEAQYQKKAAASTPAGPSSAGGVVSKKRTGNVWAVYSKPDSYRIITTPPNEFPKTERGERSTLLGKNVDKDEFNRATTLGGIEGHAIGRLSIEELKRRFNEVAQYKQEKKTYKSDSPREKTVTTPGTPGVVLITRKDGSPYKTERSLRIQAKRRGFADIDVKKVNGGFVGVEKTTSAVSTQGDGSETTKQKPAPKESSVKKNKFSKTTGPDWYSRLQNKIITDGPKKAPAKQWISTLRSWKKKNTLPQPVQEELEWSGLEDWLKLQEGKISKADVVKYLKKNGVEVDEVVKKESDKQTIFVNRPEGQENFSQDMLSKYYSFPEAIEAGEKAREEHIDYLYSDSPFSEIEEDEDDDGNIIYGFYTTSGEYISDKDKDVVEEIRNEEIDWIENESTSFDIDEEERRVTVSDHEGYVFFDASEEPIDGNVGDGIQPGPGTKFGEYTLPGGKNYQEMYITLPMLSGKGFSVPEGHSSGSGIADTQQIVRIRMNERDDVDGNKVLFVEEIQSDIVAEGRKRGWKGEKRYRIDNSKTFGQLIDEGKLDDRFLEINNEYKRNDKALVVVNTGTGNIEYVPYDEKAAERYIKNKEEQTQDVRVPNIPFKTTWQDLALKKIIRYAALNNFDKVAWVSGEQTAARYDLRKQVKEINYRDNGDKTFAIEAVDNNGRRIWKDKRASLSKIEDNVGKDIANKISNGVGSPTTKEGVKALEGDDLKAGGGWASALYNKSIPAKTNRLIKKFGGKVGVVNLGKGEHPDKVGQQLGFTITPKLRESAISQGMPLFAKTTIPTGTTVPEAQQEAKSFLGRKVYKRWTEDGTLKIVQSTEGITGVEIKSKDGKVSGYYDPSTGQITLIADNIKKGGVTGVLLHEAAHKLLHSDPRFQKDRAKILDSISKDTSQAVKAARARAIEAEGKDAAPDLIAEETLTYLMESKAGQKTSIIRRVIAAVKRALRRIGLPVGKYSHDELVQMFKAGIRKVGNTNKFSPTNPDIRYSIASDIKEKVAHPISENESFNKFMHHIVDKNRSIEQIQKRLGGVKEELDLFMKETQRPKISAYLTEKFWSEHVQPFIEKTTKNKIEISKVEELAHALHAPEANEALRNAKAKSYIDDILHSDINKKLKNKLEGAVFEAEKDPDNLPKGYRLALEKFLKQHGGEVEKIRDSWERFIEKPSGMTDQEAADIVKKYKGNKKIHALVDRISAINDEKLDILRDAGLITDDEYKAYKNKYKHYVPLYREGFEGEVSSGTGAGLQAPGKPIKARGGSARGVVDIFANTVKNYETALIRAEKAKSMETLYKLVKNNPDPELWHIKEEKKAPYYDSWGNLKEYPTQQLNKNEIRIKVNGKPYIIEVNRDDPTAMRMIETLRADAPSHGPIVNFLAKINRFLAAVNTSYAPEFILGNFIRDLPTGLINISEHNLSSYEMFKKVKQSMKTIAKVEMGKKVSKEEYDLYTRYKKAGGKISWMDVHETAQDLAKKIQKEYEHASGKRPVRSTVRKWNELWQHLNTAVENSGRFATFKLGVENGMSDTKAAQMAADLTVDFTKKGTMSPVLNSLYIFFNASVQGNYRILRTLINSPKARKMVGGLAMMGFMAGVWNAAAGGDDLEDYLKERNLVIKIPGSKKMIKIPLPYGFNFFVNAGYEMANMVTNKDYSPVKGAARLANVLAGSFNPIQAGTLLQTLAPTVLDPFVQVGENKTWFGGELMPAQDKYAKVKKPDSQRYWKSVSAPAKWLASMMNEITGGNEVRSGLIDVSPETLDLVIDTMGGSAFRFVKDVSLMPGRALNNELPMYKIPFVRRVMSEVPEYATSKKYYRLREDLFTREAESKVYPDKFKLDAKEKRLLRIMKRTERKISKLRKKLRAVSDKKRKDILKGRIDALQKVVVGMAG